MGYDPNFIEGRVIPLPELGARLRPVAFQAGEPIFHTRFSIVFNQARGFAVYTAHNIGGDSIIPAGEIPRRDDFRPDPEVPEALQVNNVRGYRNNPWDRGHLVRRRALHWGAQDEARQADGESFFWTNIAPQHTRLHHSAWGNIENWMMEFADDANKGAAVFTGPVMTPEDPLHQNRPEEAPIQIPAGFWKIFAIQTQGDLRAAGFLVWQRDFDQADPVDFDPVLEQVRITTIEYLTGLSFAALREADPLRFEMRKALAARARGLDQDVERGLPGEIYGPHDIIL